MNYMATTERAATSALLLLPAVDRGVDERVPSATAPGPLSEPDAGYRQIISEAFELAAASLSGRSTATSRPTKSNTRSKGGTCALRTRPRGSLFRGASDDQLDHLAIFQPPSSLAPDSCGTLTAELRPGDVICYFYWPKTFGEISLCVTASRQSKESTQKTPVKVLLLVFVALIRSTITTIVLMCIVLTVLVV